MDPSSPPEAAARLDLVTLLSHASWPVTATIALLVGASVAVWLIGVLKVFQIARFRRTSKDFESVARRIRSAQDVPAILAQEPACPGLRVLGAIVRCPPGASLDRQRAAAGRAIVEEKQRARMLMPILASIASTAPFVGLFGTVYGIMDAFIRIGAAKSASLSVVAPAIGEALIATAIGLMAAIPAVLFYNAVEKQVTDLVAEIEASAAEWVAILADSSRGSATTSRPAQ